MQLSGPLLSAEFEQSEDANLHHSLSVLPRAVEFIYLSNFKVVMKIEKTNRVLCGAVHSVEFEQNEDANLHHSLSVLPRVPRK